MKINHKYIGKSAKPWIRGVARGGAPCIPKGNDTLYRGLWRAASLSSSQPPLPPPHFEKSGYALASDDLLLLSLFSKALVQKSLDNDT